MGDLGEEAIVQARALGMYWVRRNGTSAEGLQVERRGSLSLGW